MSWWWLLPASFVSFWLGAYFYMRGDEVVRAREVTRWRLAIRRPTPDVADKERGR